MSTTIIQTVYTALRVTKGRIRRVWLEADTDADARKACEELGLGFEGAAKPPESQEVLAYDMEEVRRRLGGVSKSFVYKLIREGRLQRLPGSSMAVITRDSLEAYTSAKTK